MNTNLNECFWEPRKARNTRKGNVTSWSAELKTTHHSSFITHNSPTGVWLKEIQR
ncbi:MAG: hypothetical protein ACOX2I_00165 [Candidatus Ozemobacteraceae bacterium]|jgi:hypothetical protein